MPKLNMIVADSDESYLKGITAYILDKHSSKFTVCSFTNSMNLREFLSSNDRKVDILLISPDLYQEEFSKYNITLIAILSPGRLPAEYKNCEIINKYQLGDSLVTNMINLFSEKSTELIVVSGEKKTSVISVFSPIGGSGKTTIAYGCALKCAQKGMKVFYLNIEKVPSTAAFFDTSSTSNFSHILYYLKAKNKNLSLKIEGIRMEDAYSGIHYFSPPGRVSDLNDIEPEDYSHLISDMREMGFYDIIVIDMSSVLEKNNLTVMKESDEVLFVVTPEISSHVRASAVVKELEAIYQNENSVLSKFTIVLNKYFEGASMEINSLAIGEKGIAVKLPKVSPLVTMQYGRAYINVKGIFGEALDNIVSKLAV